MAHATSTWSALARPRRAVPIALVALTLLVTEWLASHSIAALVVDLSLVVAFVLIAPLSWRRLFSPTPSRLGPRALLPLSIYATVGVAVVGTLGVLLPWALGLRGTYVADPPSLGVVLALYAVGGWGLGRDIELELDTERAQLLALRAQLDPHFLFNTLNAIAEWCREDPVVAEQATLRLASMLRAVLDGIRAPLWSLAREVELVRELFALYEIRDREKYRFTLDVPEPLPDLAVPPMLLLPLVENAITHGPSAGHAGEVALRVRAGEIEIRNPGRYGGRRDGGQGIAMVERRLALAYGSRARLSIVADGEMTSTKVVLPR